MQIGIYKDFQSMSHNYLLDLDELRHYRARSSMNQYSSRCLSPQEQISSIQVELPRPSNRLLSTLKTPFNDISKQSVSEVNQTVKTKPSFQNPTKLVRKFDPSSERNREEDSIWKEFRSSDTDSDLKRAASILKETGSLPDKHGASESDECRVGEEDSSPSENMRILSIPSSKRFLSSKLKSDLADSGGSRATQKPSRTTNTGSC